MSHFLCFAIVLLIRLEFFDVMLELNNFCVVTIVDSRARFGASKMHLSPHPVASTAVHSKAVVLLLLIRCLLLLPLFVGVLFLVRVLLCSA